MRRSISIVAVAAAVVCPASAAAEVTVEGWRDAYATGLALGPGDPPAVRIEGAALAGIDQFLANVPETFEIVVKGRADGDGARLIVEWSTGGEPIRREVRKLTLAGGRQVESFNPVRRATQMRVLVGYRGSGALDLDEVGLEVEGIQLLDNPGLDADCSPEQVPAGWRSRYEGADVTLEPASSRDPLVRLQAADGPAALDQFLDAPAGAFEITVDGRVPRGRAHLTVEWSRDGQVVTSRTRPLDLRGGTDTERFDSPDGKGLDLAVIVSQIIPTGTLELRGVSLRSGGRELLRNPGLEIACLPVAEPMSPTSRDQEPSEGSAISETVIAGGAAALLAVAALVWFLRRRRSR